MVHLPNQMRPLPTDVAYPGNVPISDCVCSRCKQPIDDRTVPIWMWTEKAKWAWCYHPACVGVEDIQYEDEDDLDWDDWMLEAAAEDNEDEEEEGESVYIATRPWNPGIPVDQAEECLDLGTCCACGGEENVRNLIAMPQRAPVEGTGWGCMVCSLSSDGASAVICDRCLEEGMEIKQVINGYPTDKQRMAIADLKYVPFEHDMTKHHEEDMLN